MVTPSFEQCCPTWNSKQQFPPSLKCEEMMGKRVGGGLSPVLVLLAVFLASILRGCTDSLSPPPFLGHACPLGSPALPLPANLPLGSALVGSRESPWTPKGEVLLGWDRGVEMGPVPRGELKGAGEAEERKG